MISWLHPSGVALSDYWTTTFALLIPLPSLSAARSLARVVQESPVYAIKGEGALLNLHTLADHDNVKGILRGARLSTVLLGLQRHFNMPIWSLRFDC